MILSYRCIKVLLVAIFLFTTFVNSSRAQLTLVSFSPNDGATSVASPATFQLTFSAALDTAARFSEPEDFFLNIEIFPQDSLGDPEDVQVSEDLKTLTVSGFELTADTRFTVLLTGAKSQTGDMLDHPYVMTFTTGASLPSGAVSGQVTLDGNPAMGAAVALFEELFEDDPTLLGVATPSYSINYVPDGSYFPLSVMDTNGDGSIDPSGGDALGFYDANSDGTPDPVDIISGGTVSGIDLTITIPTPKLARASYSDMLAAAQNWSADAVVVALNSETLSANGQSFGWAFTFYSPSLQEYREFFTVGTAVFSEPQQEDHGHGVVALPNDWVDSDAALTVAEASGGSDFRSTHEDAEVYGSLSYFHLYHEGENSAARIRPSFLGAKRSFQNQHTKLQKSNAGTKLFDENVGQLAVWRFYYNSNAANEYFDVEINAQTGTLLASDVLTNVSAAEQAAQGWASDSELIHVRNEREMQEDGRSVAWGFVYQSAALDSILDFVAVGGVVLGTRDVDYGSGPFDPLPNQFCNSTDALAAAQLESQDFRALHQDVYITAELAMGFQGDPNLVVWRVGYHTFADDHFEVTLDASNCGIATNVEQLSNTAVQFSLQQNFPNPFNPSTEINYELPNSTRVELTVFNVLGQRVRSLINSFQSAGAYRVTWDGHDEQGKQVPNGIYVYQLKAGDFLQSKRMVLVR